MYLAGVGGMVKWKMQSYSSYGLLRQLIIEILEDKFLPRRVLFKIIRRAGQNNILLLQSQNYAQ